MLPPISFYAHHVRTGSDDGARVDFQEMVTQLVAHIYPGVRSVKANPGDWGIDTFVGELDSGHVTVWQTKYFINGVDRSQQSQIRDSFKSATDSAAKYGYQISNWILCIPTSMDGPNTQWWDGWKRRTIRSSKVPISLWDETELKRLLISPEAANVRSAFYEIRPSVAANPPVREPTEPAEFDSALFVRQLIEAGHVELNAAKREFFNAEIVAHEVLDKGIDLEIRQLRSADAAVHSIWEHQFNDRCTTVAGNKLEGLHALVMGQVRGERSSLMPLVSTDAVHLCGMVHRVVEDGRAGWTRNWREIAAPHCSGHEGCA